MKILIISSCSECGWCEKPTSKWRCMHPKHPKGIKACLTDRGVNIPTDIDKDCPLEDLKDEPRVVEPPKKVGQRNDGTENKPCGYCEHLEYSYDFGYCCKHKDDTKYADNEQILYENCPLEDQKEVTFSVNTDLVGCVECEFIEYNVENGNVKCCNTSHPQAGLPVSDEELLFSGCPDTVRKIVTENSRRDPPSCIRCDDFYEHEDQPGQYFCANEDHPKSGTLNDNPDDIFYRCPLPKVLKVIDGNADLEKLKKLASLTEKGCGECEHIIIVEKTGDYRCSKAGSPDALFSSLRAMKHNCPDSEKSKHKDCDKCEYLVVHKNKDYCFYNCKFEGEHQNDMITTEKTELFSQCPLKPEEKSKCLSCPDFVEDQNAYTHKYSCEKLDYVYDNIPLMERDCPLTKLSPCEACIEFRDKTIKGDTAPIHWCNLRSPNDFFYDFKKLYRNCPKKEK